MLKIKVNEELEFEIPLPGNGTMGDGKSPEWDIVKIGDGLFHVIKNHHSYKVEVLSTDPVKKHLSLKVNGRIYDVEIKDKYDQLLKELGISAVVDSKINHIVAPMPGMVVEVMLNEGSVIQKNDAVMVLEAMKMKNVLKSPSDGIIKKIEVKSGDTVQKDQVLMTLD